MNIKMKVKIATDMAMTILLILLMAYELVGQAVHEWIGIGMFVLFVLHHVLNSKWSRAIRKGKYTPLRILQTILVAAILLTMFGSMISGVILSRHVFSFLPIRGGRSLARTLHMLAAYWGFVFMSLHLGLHWSMIMGIAQKYIVKPSEIRKWVLRGIAFLTAGYGIYAFVKRDIGNYMLLKNQFVFFDFEEPFILFLIDYAAVMGVFVFAGYYLSKVAGTQVPVIFRFILRRMSF